MMQIRLPISFALACFAFGAVSSQAFAETLQKTAACPLSCKDLGIKKKFCKDSRSGEQCTVEIQSDKFARVKKGTSFSKACPLSCSTIGAKKEKCKDWKEGSTCFIERL